MQLQVKLQKTAQIMYSEGNKQQTSYERKVRLTF